MPLIFLFLYFGFVRFLKCAAEFRGPGIFELIQSALKQRRSGGRLALER